MKQYLLDANGACYAIIDATDPSVTVVPPDCSILSEQMYADLIASGVVIPLPAFPAAP